MLKRVTKSNGRRIVMVLLAASPQLLCGLPRYASDERLLRGYTPWGRLDKVGDSSGLVTAARLA